MNAIACLTTFASVVLVTLPLILREARLLVREARFFTEAQPAPEAPVKQRVGFVR